MRVLVIGGNGFIGSHVVDALLAAGHQVRVLDRRPEAFRRPLPGVEYANGDFADAGQAFEALDRVEAVVHLASTTVPVTSNLDPIADITGNLVPTVRLLGVLREAGVRRIVYLSSGGTVYGALRSCPVAEDHPLDPLSSYGIVKVAIEKYLAMERHLHGLDYVILRASNPYGPRQGHRGVQGIVGTFLWNIAGGEPIEVWGDGSVVRDYIYVEDLAELCVRALESERSGCYNAGSGEGTSVTEMLTALERATGARLDPVFRRGRAVDVPRIVLDISKARQELGWSPSIPLHQGLSLTWEWVQSQQAVPSGAARDVPPTPGRGAGFPRG